VESELSSLGHVKDTRDSRVYTCAATVGLDDRVAWDPFHQARTLFRELGEVQCVPNGSPSRHPRMLNRKTVPSELSPLEPITTVLVFATARAYVSSDSQYPSESDVNTLCEPPARCGPDRR
jgi:hypothetical protein